MAQADVKPGGGSFAGIIAGGLLLLFAGALVATSQMPGFANEAATSLRGRSLQGVTVQSVESDYTPPEGTEAEIAVAGAAEPTSQTIQTTLAADAPAGSISISVASAEKFVVGQWIMIGVGTTDPEVHHIAAITAAAIPPTIQMHVALNFDHPAGEVVALQPESLHQQSAHQISSGPSASLASLDSSFGSSSKSLDSFRSSESGSSEGNVVKFTYAAHSGAVGSSWLLNFILSLCFACIYKKRVVEPMSVMPHQHLQHEVHNDFRYGLCDCWKDINICCFTFCCPILRIAHTNETADVCGFWETLFCMWCSTLCPCGPLCLNVYFRIHIKDHMGIHDNCFMDFCAAFFCLPCITGQQAMSVDEVVGWKFKCPCNIEHVSQSGGYGQAQFS